MSTLSETDFPEPYRAPAAAGIAMVARRRVRLAFATSHSYLPQAFGGSESSTHDLVAALSRAGYLVCVSAGLSRKGFVGFRARVFQKLWRGKRAVADRVMGYPVYRAWPSPDRESAFARRARPQVVIVQAGRPLEIAYRFVALGIPTIVYLRDVEFEKLGCDYVPHRLLRFVANSEFTAATARRELGVDSVAIPPLVWPHRYETPTSREKLVFINPDPRKGVEIGLQLAERRRDIPFLFVESWAVPEETLRPIKERAARLPNVTWMTAQLDPRKIYARARAVLMPSQWNECWGRVITEAQVSGIPALASNIGGVPESVGPAGILVHPQAPIADWERGLARLWDDDATYRRLSHLAIEHSRRPAIQPETLTRRLDAVIRGHISACAG